MTGNHRITVDSESLFNQLLLHRDLPLPDKPADIAALAQLLSDNRPVLALTGAGISTRSGIPAYRDTNGKWVQSQPVNAADFKNHEHVRKRYWRRSMSGWPVFQAARANEAHEALVALQQTNVVSTIITQNVDGLHQRAGSSNVIDLHGSLATVVCLQCGDSMQRSHLQQQLESANPIFAGEPVQAGPDGDATPTKNTDAYEHFQLVHCPACTGILKPDVVFFGENVPAGRVDTCMEALQQAQSLLCIGSSLSVLSGFRFCREAAKQNKPVCVINQGKTRADEIATIKIDADCGQTLRTLLELIND